MSSKVIVLTLLINVTLTELLSSTPVAPSQSVTRICKKPNYVSIYQLDDIKPIVNKVTIKMNRVQIDQIEDHIEIIAVMRRRYTSYCYDGGWMDPNTGCIQKLRSVNISKEEAREWLSKGECKTGHECPPDGDCWGNDASKCLSDQTTIMKGPKSLKWVGQNYNVFPHHSCISSWECHIGKVIAHVHSLLSGGIVKRFFLTQTNEEVVINDQFYEKGFNGNDDFTYYPLEPKKPRKIYTSNTPCYALNSKEIYCLLEINDKKIPVKINHESFTGVHRGTIITVEDAINVIEDGEIKVIKPPKELYLTEGSPNENNPDILRAASLESLAETVSSLKVTQLQEIYNSMENMIKTNQLISVTTKLIRHLSQKDEDLLSKIIGGDFKTKWMNDNFFEKVSCKKLISIPPDSNCNSGYMYKEGVLIKTKNPEFCTYIDISKAKKIEIGGNKTDLDTTMFDIDDLHTSASDDSSWDWLVREKSNTDYSSTINGGSWDPSNFLSTIKDQIGLPTLSTIIVYFNLVSSMFFWLSLLLRVKA